MKMLTIVFLFLSTSIMFPQKYLERELSGNVAPDQLVSLSPNLSFAAAVELLSKVSENTTGRRIISTVAIEDPIGIELTNISYDKALIILVQLKGLMYEEKEDVIVIRKKSEVVTSNKTADNYATVDSREVKISAVFFEADVNSQKQKGVDWKVLFQKNGLSVGGQIGNTTPITTDEGFQVNTTSTFNFGGFFADATAIFKFFENENLGEIIANPSIVTRDRIKGRIQVGTDISIKQKDFAGNVIENFFSTGSIIEVTPFVYSEDGVDYILLNIAVERSSFIPDPTTTSIAKTSASSQVILLNGEETVIGGLFVNDETIVRSGVPILKDLPWWFFGLRYIFGKDDIRVSKKELVISIKAELVPTLKERLAGPKSLTPMKDAIDKNREQMKLYDFKQQDTTNENK